ncbi:MAG: four helix bundle protein [Patescibacteria group bacterium]
MEGEKLFHEKLKEKMDIYVHLIYKITRNFPREELYGIISQLRRAALSVVLNYIEGYARLGNKMMKNFHRISYASLKESEYLLEFSKKEGFNITEEDYGHAVKLADEIGAMLWKTIDSIDINND